MLNKEEVLEVQLAKPLNEAVAHVLFNLEHSFQARRNFVFVEAWANIVSNFTGLIVEATCRGKPKRQRFASLVVFHIVHSSLIHARLDCLANVLNEFRLLQRTRGQ